MFTGLIIGMGEVSSIVKNKGGARLGIKSGDIAKDAGLGDSISINGTCLTVVGMAGEILSFDLSDETLNSTNMGSLKIRDRVNLEPAMRPDSRMGGHFVTGHIDGVGRIISRALEGETYKILIGVDEGIAGYLVEKGSVAVDGISLTVVDVTRDSFSIVIIPHTAKMTTIGYKSAGDTVNVEVDILGKYVAKFLRRQKTPGLMDALIREGFA
ncbi:MAG: riboflavin synthase [Nitrospirae bacterium]|nr:riboflavin synthase [Nitrospirota bacterium]